MLSPIRTTNFGRASVVTSGTVFSVGLLIGAVYFMLLELGVTTWSSLSEDYRVRLLYHIDGYELALFSYILFIAPLGYVAGILFGLMSYSRHRRKNVRANVGLVMSSALFVLQVIFGLTVFGVVAILLVVDTIIDALSHLH
jgi:hypothetical protein